MRAGVVRKDLNDLDMVQDVQDVRRRWRGFVLFFA